MTDHGVIAETADQTLNAGIGITDCHRAYVALLMLPDGNRSGRFFLLTDDEHIRNFLELPFANLVINLFVPVIELDPDAGCLRSAATWRAYACWLSVIGRTAA